MFVRSVREFEASGKLTLLLGGTFRSARLITAEDGMGFSYHDNQAPAGLESALWYKHHWEANYVASGRGEVTDLTTGQVWPLEPGALYVVGPNDRHRVRVLENMHAISVFCPALRGDERHDEDGSYSPSGPIPQTDRRMFVRRVDEVRDSGKGVEIAHGQAQTLRLLTRADDVGFSFSVVYPAAGMEALLWYKHHWEANHILSGTGEVTDLTTGQSWKLEPGVIYNVGPKDRHRVRTDGEMNLISVFCPPLQGDEVHDEDGSYPPSGPVPPGPPGY